MWNPKYDTKEPIYKIRTDLKTQRTDWQLPRKPGVEWIGEAGVTQTVIYEWINKVLLYSTGNYVQHPVINHNGKKYKYKKECTYMYN